jgi:hypothetical protein
MLNFSFTVLVLNSLLSRADVRFVIYLLMTD